MKNKYYIPELSDLFVGYECEIDSNIYAGNPSKWENLILKEGNFDESLAFGRTGHLRTPYLTKEQIEKEGWTVEWVTNLYTSFTKGDVRLIWAGPYQENYFEFKNMITGKMLYYHKIPYGVNYSINEFRKIIKSI